MFCDQNMAICDILESFPQERSPRHGVPCLVLRRPEPDPGAGRPPPAPGQGGGGLVHQQAGAAVGDPRPPLPRVHLHGQRPGVVSRGRQPLRAAPRGTAADPPGNGAHRLLRHLRPADLTGGRRVLAPEPGGGGGGPCPARPPADSAPGAGGELGHPGADGAGRRGGGHGQRERKRADVPLSSDSIGPEHPADHRRRRGGPARRHQPPGGPGRCLSAGPLPGPGAERERPGPPHLCM